MRAVLKASKAAVLLAALWDLNQVAALRRMQALGLGDFQDPEASGHGTKPFVNFSRKIKFDF